MEEHKKALERRLYELMQNKTKKAYTEWYAFFKYEFTTDVDLSVMQILLDIVRAYPIQRDVINLILNTMSERVLFYQDEGENEKALMASEIVKYAQMQIPQNTGTEDFKKFSHSGRKKPIGIVLGSVFFLVIALGILGSFIGEFSERKVCKQAVEYLNEKYGEMGYTENDFKVHEAYLYGEAEKEFQAYFISEQETYTEILYALKKKNQSNYIFFDNLQTSKIKDGLEIKINEVTGCENGRISWNSYSGGNGLLEDGFYHTFYDGNIDTFMENEMEVRIASQDLKMKDFKNSMAGRNGNCNYYIPDQEIETMKQRLEMQEMEKNQELQNSLKQCADQYHIQIRGYVVPKSFFDKKVIQVLKNEHQILAYEEIYSDSYLVPSLSFLFTTGWYVNLPEEDSQMSQIKNMIYGEIAVPMGNGIYGVYSQIDGDMTSVALAEFSHSFQKVPVPKTVPISEEQKKHAVSIQLQGHQRLNADIDLAIDKETYGITDRGYQAYITEPENENGEFEEQTDELSVISYQNEELNIRYQGAMDGEGFIFLQYPSFWEWEEAQIITFVNP